jgi:serine/threonine-protein kinase
VPQAVTRDGSQLIFLEIASTGNDDLMIMNVDGDRKPAPLIATHFRERNAALSPNGRWLAYQSDKSTREEVWVTPFPYSPANGEWKVSAAGGTRPRWISDGELAYVEEVSGQLWTVAVRESGKAVAVDPPVVLLNRLDPVTIFSGGRTYDVSNDGRRILAPIATTSTARDSEPRARVILIQHWFEELKRRVPAK